jgi:hypothetical protein
MLNYNTHSKLVRIILQIIHLVVYILYSVVEGRPLLAVDFSIFRGHIGQQAGHRRPVAAAKFEAWYNNSDSQDYKCHL